MSTSTDFGFLCQGCHDREAIIEVTYIDDSTERVCEACIYSVRAHTSPEVRLSERYLIDLEKWRKVRERTAHMPPYHDSRDLEEMER